MSRSADRVPSRSRLLSRRAISIGVDPVVTLLDLRGNSGVGATEQRDPVGPVFSQSAAPPRQAAVLLRRPPRLSNSQRPLRPSVAPPKAAVRRRLADSYGLAGNQSGELPGAKLRNRALARRPDWFLNATAKGDRRLVRTTTRVTDRQRVGESSSSSTGHAVDSAQESLSGGVEATLRYVRLIQPRCRAKETTNPAAAEAETATNDPESAASPARPAAAMKLSTAATISVKPPLPKARAAIGGNG
jgi:hypothetical protein